MKSPAISNFESNTQGAGAVLCAENLCACGCGTPTAPGKQWRRGHNSSPSAVAYIVDDNGCWVWQRSAWRSGYARMKVEGKWTQAYRVYYEQEHGPIPEGLTIDHLCRNRRCVNPAHLEACSLQENLRRAGVLKLTAGQRAVIASSDESHKTLAGRYGITANYVWAIKNRVRKGT